MILHYLKVAVRSLMKYKMQTAISIVGLAVGFVCLAFSMIWIRYELTYDDFHRGAERMSIVYCKSNHELSGYSSSMCFPLAAAIKKDFPEVEDAAAFVHWLGPVGRQKNETMMAYQLITDSAFIRMFDVRLLKGSWNFLHRDEEVALTSEAAQRIFHTEDVLGKELFVYGAPKKVTAVLSGWGKHSNFRYDVVSKVYEGAAQDYMTSSFYVCLRTHEGVNETSFAQKLNQQVFTGSSNAIMAKDLLLEKLTSCRYTLFQNNNQIALQYIRLFSWVGLLIIGIALVNFFSMLVTRIRIRRREIGLRVVCGSGTFGLFRMFVTELVVLLLAGGLLGMLLLELMEKKFCELSAVDDTIYLPAFGYFLLIFIVSIAVSVVIILYYSRKSLVEVLSRPQAGWRERMFFQKGSIVTQFVISLLVMFGLAVLFKQLYYLSHTDIGFERDGRATLTFLAQDKEEQVIQKIQELPYVYEVKKMLSLLPRFASASMTINSWDGKVDEQAAISVQVIPEGQAFMDFYGIKLIQGTYLSEQADNQTVLINETAVKQLGWADPIGKKLADKTVVGVFKDCHISSPTDPVQPMMLTGKGNILDDAILIRFDESHAAELRRAVEDYMRELDASLLYQFSTVREAYDEYLTSERSLMKLLAFVSVVCIVISLFGVYSHVTLACERRRKGIAIRKVNGATAWLIMQSFLKQYVWMLLLSCLIAFPVGTLVMRRWLEQYVEQTTINGWLYGLIMVILALFIGLCTGRSVWRAAHENPAEVIKRE